MKTVTLALYGGLGNQLFQLAAATGIAQRTGRVLTISPSSLHPTHESLTDTLILDILTGHGLLETEASSPLSEEVCREPSPHELMPLPASECERIRLHGYFQNAGYFSGAEERILSLFHPLAPRELIYGPIALHLRMGDYLQVQDTHPVISEEYLRKAVFWQLSRRASPVIHLYSDSPAEAASFLEKALSGLHVSIDVRPGNTVEQLQALAAHVNMIGSNSSFSWWAAWLHRSGAPAEHQLVLPARWYGPRGPKEWQGIYRDVTRGVLAIF